MKKLALVILLFSGVLWASQIEIDSRNPSDSTVISGEWEILEFVTSDELADKRSEYDDCYAKGKDSAICEKILYSWRESCARGEEKYCIGAFLFHSDSYITSLIDTPKQKSDNSKIDESLTLLKQNCDKDMANSCHIVGEFYNEIYLKMRRSSKDEPHKERQMLDNALLYFHKSCDLGMAISCLSIAKYWSFQGDTGWEQVDIYTDKARRIVDKDCKAGVKIACEYKEDVLD